MGNFNWIMSEGGALICAELKYANTWGGISRLTVPCAGAENDYDRTNKKLDFLQAIALSQGSALLFGEGPADTSFWTSSDDQLFIIRIIYCDADADFQSVMQAVDEDVFRNPREILDFSFSSSPLTLFDSAYEGDAPDRTAIEASIKRGRYQILTQLYDPDEQTKLILHRFDRLG